MTREQIISEANERMEMGQKKYGDYNPATDTRDLYKDMREELLDFINYAIMQIQKIDLRTRN
jgi:hypothetical protein